MLLRQNLYLGRILFICYFLQDCVSIKIVQMSTPRSVENGTVDSVILDCDYTYTSNDKNIVVKWFLNSDPEPVYQWITEYDSRQVSSRYIGHVNRNFVVNPSNKFTKHRALNIIRPTIQHNGVYSCHVVSLASQDTFEKTMIVYAKPREVSFNCTKTGSYTANLTCLAEGIFPTPQFKLYRRTSFDSNWLPIIGSTDRNTMRDDGSYDSETTYNINDKLLPAFEPTTFLCVLNINQTDVKEERSLIYYPGPSYVDSASRLKFSLVYLPVILELIISRF